MGSRNVGAALGVAALMQPLSGLAQPKYQVCPPDCDVRIGVTFQNNKCVFDMSEVVLLADVKDNANNEVRWSIVTNGYQFRGVGIDIKAPPSVFQTNAGSSTLQKRHATPYAPAIYKYDVLVKRPNGFDCAVNDPLIVNRD